MTQEQKWYRMAGDDADVVISTRVRLARNLRGIPFPCVMSAQARERVNRLVRDAAVNGGSALSGRFRYITLGSLSSKQLVSMVERHLISPAFAHDPAGKAMLLLDDESVSIMICEEDHLRIQVLRQGLALEEAYDLASKIDMLLSERLDYARSDKLGYLTACPTNLGTAMRASVMVHIPAIEASGEIIPGEDLESEGIVIRGMYGEGTGSKAAIYQISDQQTLGVDEKHSIAKLGAVISRIAALERKRRDSLRGDPSQTARVWEAYDTLRRAGTLSGGQFVSLFSPLRMGVACGIIPNIGLDTLNALFIDAQPATLMCEAGRDLSPAQRDIIRAELVKKALE